MFGFGNKAEAPQPAPQQEQEQKDAGQEVDEMLNDKGFTEFLGRYKDRIDLSNENADQVRERYERFKQVGVTIKEVQNILAHELSTETGVKIAGNEIEGARDHLEDMAVNNEGEFDQTLETIKEYHRTSQEADQMIEEVKQRFVKAEMKQVALTNVKQVSKFKRWIGLGRNEQDKQAISDAKALKLDRHHPERSDQAVNAEGLAAQAAAEGELTEKLQEFDAVRMELMTSLGENTGALKLAKDKLTSTMRDSVGTSLADADRTAAMYGEYANSEEDGELTFDYLEGVEGFDRKEFLENLNKEAEERATTEIKNAVNMSHLGNSQMNRLESAVDKYLKREHLGTKDQEQTGKFVLGVVHEMYSRFASDPMRFQNKDIMSKSFLLQRILVKNGVNPKEDYAKDMMDAEAKQKEEDAAKAAEAEQAATEKQQEAENPEPTESEEDQDTLKEITVGDQSFKPFQKVTVKRTNGDIEDDWTLGGVYEGRAVLSKPNPEKPGELIVKSPKQEEFLKWQPKAEEPATGQSSAEPAPLAVEPAQPSQAPAPQAEPAAPTGANGEGNQSVPGF